MHALPSPMGGLIRTGGNTGQVGGLLAFYIHYVWKAVGFGVMIYTLYLLSVCCVYWFSDLGLISVLGAPGAWSTCDYCCGDPPPFFFAFTSSSHRPCSFFFSPPTVATS